MDKYVVIKLISSEEIVCTQIEETEYDIKTLFPMLVKTVPRLADGKIMESITLAPYTYFAADDQFTFNKSHVVFCKDLSENHIQSYKLAVDDFVANSVLGDQPNDVEDLKEALDKLAEVFSDQIELESNDIETDSLLIDLNNKSIH